MIRKTVKKMCHTCNSETEWMIVHRLVDYHGIRHCFECSHCGTVVPDFAFRDYVRTGKIIIGI